MQIDKKQLSNIKAIFFDFDGVFTDNKVTVSQDGTESVTCSRGDGMGIGLLSEIGIMSYIISSETNSVVSERAKKLNILCEQAVSNKAKVITEICEKHEINLSDTIFVGNDINDLEAFSVVGVSVAVKDSHEDIFGSVDFVTTKKGGDGAVREICDLLWRSRGIRKGNKA